MDRTQTTCYDDECESDEVEVNKNTQEAKNTSAEPLLGRSYIRSILGFYRHDTGQEGISTGGDYKHYFQ